jgi:hypothetical protein
MKQGFQYHLWFNLKPEAEEATALAAARSFLSEQLSSGNLTGFRLVRNAADPQTAKLPRYLALIDYQNRDQFDDAFSALRRVGIHLGNHGELMKMVSDFRVEFTEDLE